MSRGFAPILTFISLGLFWLAVSQQGNHDLQLQPSPPDIVITPTSQVLLYGGDRFLAANIEAIRAAAASTAQDAESFRLRSHQGVSRLNPCHEDNYWIGNASLSWGGAEEEGFELLRNAMHCRYWDEWPAFFYGFNQNFFLHNVDKAREFLELAALRSSTNAATFRTFSTMLAVSEVDDTKMALKMLRNERDTANDPQLREMLDKRVRRLNGLLILRDARASFEEKFNRPLKQPQELLDYGLLERLPEDPLGIGYLFRNQEFHLRQMEIQ